MLLKELYKKYDKEYNIVVFGVPLKEMKEILNQFNGEVEEVKLKKVKEK